MITLKKLGEITDNKIKSDIAELNRIEQEKRNELEKEFIFYTENLEEGLLDAAQKGKREFRVFNSSFYNCDNFSSLKIKKGNFLTNWLKTIFVEDIIICSKNNFKRIYDFCKEQKLNPQIKYSPRDDDDYFEIIIEW